jgi:predicted enzyme related to lactoylglutathione lyase
MPTPNTLAHFAINADDIERAQRFYSQVFGWQFEAWGPPGFYMIKTKDGKDPGCFGSLQKRHEPVVGSGTERFDCTIAVTSVAETAKKVEKAGGKITMPKMTINTVGHLIKFKDTEGNTVGAMEYDENAS